MQESPRATSESPPGETLADRVRQAAARGGSSPALICQEQVVTWAELDRRVDDAARALHRSAPVPASGPPPRVAIALTNTLDFAVAYFATLRAGLVAVPVNPACTARELRHVLHDAQAAVLVGTAQVCRTAQTLAAELPALVAVHADLPAEPNEPLPTRTGNELAVLLYTSGTEGNPKGAMLTHRALLANHEQLDRLQPTPVGPDDVVLLALPLFHAYGLNTGLGAVAYHGACGVLVERFEAADVLAAVARHRVTAVLGVPSMYAGWARQPGLGAAMASVRIAVCGAAPLDPDAARRFTEAAGHPVFVGYGLTESAPVLTSTLASPEPKAGSVGRPIPGVELRLVSADGEQIWCDGVVAEDELDDGYASPGTDPGEIVVRGDNLFSGYWPDGRDGPDTEGWWATGDVAYADADGDLFLVDRLGELILVNGFNVYPHEVELVLNAHPGIAESAVLGTAHPETGQAVAAYVVRAVDSTVTAEEVLAHCSANLARFKCPTTVEFVGTLPHSVIGKVRKTLLRSEHADG